MRKKIGNITRQKKNPKEQNQKIQKTPEGERRFLFFYLNTGAGHISAAKVLSDAIKNASPESSVKMLNGFVKHGLGKLIFEQGYFYATNYFRGMYPIMFDAGQRHWVQSTLKYLLGWETTPHLRKIIKKEHPTDIVCFHFAVTPFLREALKSIPWKVNFHVIVTDPFTMPYAWFYEKDIDYLVYSKEAKEMAVRDCKIPEDHVRIIPFLMNNKFNKTITKDEVRALKIKHGFDPNKKIVLLVGGGDGLPGATEIINSCILHKAKFAIAVICGKDKVKKRNLTLLGTAHPKLDLHVYGFVDYFDELARICDCAVIKAGPATLFELLFCRKPVIICKYLHNQELGNMRYAVDNKVGFFIRKPGKIYKKINEILSDNDFDEKMKGFFDNIKIDTDASKVATLLLE